MLTIYNDLVNVCKFVENWDTSDFVKYVESCHVSQCEWKKEVESFCDGFSPSPLRNRRLKMNESNDVVPNHDVQSLSFSRGYLANAFTYRNNINSLFLSMFEFYGLNFDHTTRIFPSIRRRECTQWNNNTKFNDTTNFQRTFWNMKHSIEYAINPEGILCIAIRIKNEVLFCLEYKDCSKRSVWEITEGTLNYYQDSLTLVYKNDYLFDVDYGNIIAEGKYIRQGEVDPKKYFRIKECVKSARDNSLKKVLEQLNSVLKIKDLSLIVINYVGFAGMGLTDIWDPIGPDVEIAMDKQMEILEKIEAVEFASLKAQINMPSDKKVTEQLKLIENKYTSEIVNLKDEIKLGKESAITRDLNELRNRLNNEIYDIRWATLILPKNKI